MKTLAFKERGGCPGGGKGYLGSWETAFTLSTNQDQSIMVEHVMIAGNIIGRQPENGGHQLGVDDSGECYTLTKTDIHAVATVEEIKSFGWQNSAHQGMAVDDITPTLDKSKTPAVMTAVVRRLTPLECERLQGFPDTYTNIPGATDAKRYAALGNSMTVQVMNWLGQRIQQVENALEILETF